MDVSASSPGVGISKRTVSLPKARPHRRSAVLGLWSLSTSLLTYIHTCAYVCAFIDLLKVYVSIQIDVSMYLYVYIYI